MVKRMYSYIYKDFPVGELKLSSVLKDSKEEVERIIQTYSKSDRRLVLRQVVSLDVEDDMDTSKFLLWAWSRERSEWELIRTCPTRFEAEKEQRELKERELKLGVPTTITEIRLP